MGNPKDGKRITIGPVDKKINDAFTKHCRRLGLLKGRALDGALKMFLECEPGRQLEAMAKALPGAAQAAESE